MVSPSGSCSRSPRISSGWLDLALLAIIALASGVLIFSFGKSGFHFEDLSIVYDGGYRILAGQLPYVDFSMPWGPVPFLQQALFASLFGVNLNTLLLHAAVLNGIVVLLAYASLRPYGREAALVAALGTSTCFFLIPAAPHYDQIAFVWAFAALALVIGTAPGKSISSSRLVIAGALSGVAYLCKGNIGAAGILALAGVTLLRQSWRSLVPCAAGVLIPLAAMAGYLTLVGGWQDYLYYSAVVPTESPRRLVSLVPQAVKPLWNLVRPGDRRAMDWIEFVYELGALVVVLLAGAHYLRHRHGKTASLALGVMAMVVLQYLSYQTSNNDLQMYQVFMGVIAAGLCVLLLRQTRAYRPALLLVGLGLAVWGSWTGASRDVHGPVSRENEYTVKEPSLSGLRLDARQGPAFDEMVAYLRQNGAGQPGQRVWIFPAQTVLYGALESPAPQPLLCFFPGSTYSRRDPTRSDERVLRALQQNDVTWVVIEDTTVAPDATTEAVIEDLPRVADYVRTRFRLEKTIPDHYFIYHIQ